MIHFQRLSVPFEYPVYFGTGVFEPASSALAEILGRREPGRRHRVAVVVEQRVAELWPALCRDIDGYARHHAARMSLVAPPRVEPGTEACKNDPRAPAELHRWFDALGLDRQSFVLVVGGGALLDMVGYAAATAHRGIRLVRVPTTVLAQNDSGVGVKNGVNALGKKNFLGAFAPPFAVLNDARFLETLDPRDRVAGMAEAVKVALVKDGPFFEWLVDRAAALAAFDRPAVAELVRRCAILHLDHIAGGGDPFELGSSRPLDFGHWAAHKLESLSGYALRHGEAVAVGIALDTRYSTGLGLLAPTDADRVLALLRRLGLPTWDPHLDLRAEDGRRMVLGGIAEFREHLGGDLTLMMLEAPGRGREVREMDVDLVERSIEFLRPEAAATLRSVSLAGGDAAVNG